MSVTPHFTVRLALAVSMLLVTACGPSGSTADSAMQPAMDSLKLWFSQMNGDSMQTKSQRIALYLQQHRNDGSASIRRLRAE